MKDPRPQPIHRKDYRPPAFWIDEVDLHFELGDTQTRVTSVLRVRRNEAVSDANAPLFLDGEQLELQEIAIDGTPLPPERYELASNGLTIPDVPDRFELRTVVTIRPQDNTELSGLYRSGATFCTQCEAEGFRRITYFLDRPDVMARYRTTIVAEQKRYPVLLSNGNRVDAQTLADGRHQVTWEDPFPKPCYLFALVAADLRAHSGTFVTRSGREVRLEIWVEPHNIGACEHALQSLRKAMKWDEDVYGLEYDLDVYMIVAVSDFNMAAMENKGLNIFNDKYVLARPETATDDDYEDIEGVIAHEYFHNWTGNRVTCRDWFQLTLKEGLTVFRDERFTADMTSPAVKRVSDVRTLRTAQFAEDQSPTAHPIRPEAYIEMNNFYTVTVYNKGAEVVRMYQTLLGVDGFRRGMDLYFERHDGQAVTCDDFRAAMADATGVDLTQFGRWYEQAGTPLLEVEGRHDPAAKTYSLTLRQRPPVNVEARGYEPLHIPVAVGLVAADGHDMPLELDRPVRIEGTTAILELRRLEETFVFRNVATPAIPSVLRDFSAPVKLRIERELDELAFLMAHDSDPVNRWDAAQSLAQALLLDGSREFSRGGRLELDPRFVTAWGHILDDADLNASMRALTLALPDERLLGQAQPVVDVDGLHAAREHAMATLGRAHAEALTRVYHAHRPRDGYRSDRPAIDARRLCNTTLAFFVASGDTSAIELALRQFHQADNMTDAQAALMALANVTGPAHDEAVDGFYRKWQREPLVIDKWFSVQALSSRADAVDRVIALTEHPDFNLRNPNRVRSLLGVFSVRNQARFHDASGRGYDLLAEKILELDRSNPQVAARLVGAFAQWRRFDPARAELMKQALGRIVRAPKLSRDVFELVSKNLGEDA